VIIDKLAWKLSGLTRPRVYYPDVQWQPEAPRRGKLAPLESRKIRQTVFIRRTVKTAIFVFLAHCENPGICNSRANKFGCQNPGGVNILTFSSEPDSTVQTFILDVSSDEAAQMSSVAYSVSKGAAHLFPLDTNCGNCGKIENSVKSEKIGNSENTVNCVNCEKIRKIRKSRKIGNRRN
jgi:hypothetical protein